MTNYNFTEVLSAVDFELLSKDLLDAELNIRLENFREGRDKGIDLRFAPIKVVHSLASLRESVLQRPSLIVQCKRYSTYASLKSHLKNKELSKIARLNPERYILTTSVSLSPQQADELKELLSPHVQSTGDIYGRERLNSLLEAHPEIERRHIKLWVHSAGVLNAFLNAGTHVVSREEVERTIAAARIYVRNPSFDEALQILKRDQVCIISGIPGIGKTTLARMLLLYFYDRDYDVVKIESDVSEARTVGYHSKPRFYLYDDFLGQTAQADKLNKNEDQKLLDFMASVRASKQSVLVLTTREYILNQARLHYEKLARERFDYRTCIVDLSKYSRRIRAQILYNHLHFSELPRAHLEELVAKRGYIKIVDHKNYNPRLIEYLTDPAWIGAISSHDYLAYFLQHLDNPVLIWDHAFRNQLSDRARHLLFTLTTMPTEVRLSDLEQAFAQLHERQCQRCGIARRPADYMTALKELDGTFVATKRVRETTLIRFQNPSIRDFMKHLLTYGEHVEDIIASSIFFEQPYWLSEILAGRKPGSSPIPLSKHGHAILEAMRRLTTVPSCSITVERYGTNERVALQEANQAWRLSQIASSESALTGDRDDTFVRSRLEYLTEALRSDHIRASACLVGVEILRDLGHLSTEQGQQFVTALKERAAERPTEIEDFETLTKIVRVFPTLFSETELSIIRNAYEGYARQSAEDCTNNSWEIDDPDVIREESVRIENVGNQLGVAVDEFVQMIDDFANEKEQEAEARRDQERDDDGEYFGSSGSWDQCTDDELNSMFGTLRE
jgi:hypothetical protein